MLTKSPAPSRPIYASAKPPAPAAPRPDRPKDLAFRSLVRTLGLLDRVMGPYFARFGITGSQWSVLRALHRAESEGFAGLRLTDLSERLVIRPPSVTGVVDRLERLSLVVRESVAGDLRVKMVRLTPKAKNLLDRVLVGHEAQIDNVLSVLSPADHDQLFGLLSKLNAHLERLSELPGGTSNELH